MLFRRCFWPLAIAWGFVAVASAQPPAVTLPTFPQVPTLNPITPSGMTRGTTLELAVSGSNLDQPIGVRASFPVQAEFPTDANNGNDPGKLRVKLTVPADAPIGMQSLAIVTKRGISNATNFCVDDLPQVIEVDTNRAKTTPQVLAIPAVVAARADGEVTDWFQFAVTANQRLSFEVIGHRLGSPIDPVIRIYSQATGRELPGIYSDDAPGAQTDSRLTYTFKDAGNYLISVHDQQYRGGPNFFYRLRIGDFPIAIAAYPMGVQRGQAATVNFAGTTPDPLAPAAIPAIPDLRSHVSAAPRYAQGGASGWPVDLFVTDAPNLTDIEPNNDAAKAQKLTLPVNVTGRFLDKGDVDCYAITLTKGQRLKVVGQTYEVLSPSELYLTLKNAMGGEVAKSNPQQAATIDFTAPADGVYTLQVEQLNFVSGPNEVYFLQLSHGAADFAVKLGVDRVSLAPGTTSAIPILAQTRTDLPGPIEVSITGIAGVTGSVVIEPGRAPLAPNLPLMWLPITVAPNVAMGSYPLQIEAKSTVGTTVIRREAVASDVIASRFSGLPFPPRVLQTETTLAVTAPASVKLSATLAANEAAKTVPLNLTIRAERAAGVDGEIALTAFGVPPNVTLALKPIPKGMNEVVIPLTAAIAVPETILPLIIRGQIKVNNRDEAMLTAPISPRVTLPATVTLEPAGPVSLKIGQKTNIKAKIARLGTYAGPVAIEVKNLPANVTAARVTAAPDQAEVTLELTAAGNAMPGDKGDVQLSATATGAGNQVANSPNWTLKVVK
ncbi:PPC domain-containing protein [Tuwongella immobilis]|uniref:Peptidase C-terminal archaeal/bacterial domain-containing protein n=1 Tax=Tuwongella immobilis TaxID=692036 RepID=A0A6C2YID0_9BACT|nr:PPC domain-containing protein [Tuwongella immobilis]VIP01124.1 Uncharacterized protein OS=Singulisphaera acidiphila (strain ATCC BAA-1392 / DSM 18658 / VKM B-2454 / MOB10) GN=Sinac_5272 PE=4 SV=1: PPC [Tuwongella immobilis]VTR97673.1 Uncharacterized protein OS=Singulisphaera acidiphila (strain ATCC BAA-1392 / DSM 18658 / VKM B-2454 / MOB10) GN=Sinac_5272 PE=4 SV=1: PPC [Tuwongella immobilis]